MNWEIIKEKCPKLFRNGIVFACGPGWSDLLLDLCIKIEAILDRNPDNEMFSVQVKEKYGTLRFYMSIETDEISDLIEEAEALSSQTCERCGSPGELRGSKWMEVRCNQCYQERK